MNCVILLASTFASLTPNLFEPCDGPKPSQGSSAAFTASVADPNEMAMFDHPRGLSFSHDGGSTWHVQTAPEQCAPFLTAAAAPYKKLLSARARQGVGLRPASSKMGACPLELEPDEQSTLR